MQKKHKSSECKVDMRRRLRKADKKAGSKGDWNQQGARKGEGCKEKKRETGAYRKRQRYLPYRRYKPAPKLSCLCEAFGKRRV